MEFYEFIAHVIAMGGIDNDGYYGMQCMDLYNYYCIKVLGTEKGETGCSYAKQIVTTENNTRFFDVYKNTPDFIPEAGDVFVITGGKYGHVGIVTERGTLHEFKTLEQNKNGTRQLTREVRGYSVNGELYFLRPKNRANLPQMGETENTNKGEYEMRVWKNGTTKEIVYQDSRCTKKIGFLNPHETAYCVAEVDGVYAIWYAVDNTWNGQNNNNKIGFVKYRG